MKNRVIAGLLALILGVFGTHKLYLRQTMSALIYLFLFFVTYKFFPVTIIMGILDAIRIFNMSDYEFNSKYNKEYLKNGRYSPTEDKFPRDSQRRQMPDNTFRIFPRKNPFKKSALEKFENFDFKGAIEDYKKALDISPDDAELHYQIAKAYSLTENKELAFRQLDTAIQYGLKSPERISTDTDLAFLRVQPEYEDFKSRGFRLSPKSLNSPKSDLLENDVLLAQIKKLKELKDKGILSDVDFETERKKIILPKQ